MRRLVAVGVVVGVLAAGAPVSAGGDPPESCLAVNPVQPSCMYTATFTSTTPVSGLIGRGDWIVTIKRGKAKLTYRSPYGGDPTVTGFVIEVRDKVTAKALTAGSSVLTGSAG